MSYNPTLPAQKLTALGQTSGGTLTLPANAVIQSILVKNNTANAVTGGIKFGSTNGGVDIAAALAVGASATVGLAPGSLLKTFFSTVATQTIYFDAVVAWNSASVTITIIYVQL